MPYRIVVKKKALFSDDFKEICKAKLLMLRKKGEREFELYFESKPTLAEIQAIIELIKSGSYEVITEAVSAEVVEAAKEET